MSRRIRTIKPEWLEDERLALASSEARVLSIALIILADDYGNGRANQTMLAGQVFPGKILETLAKALEELRTLKFVVLYEVDGQHYFHIRNWERHQKVDKPGRPKVPVFSAKYAPVEKVRESVANPPEGPEKIRLGPGPGPGPGRDLEDLSSSLPTSSADSPPSAEASGPTVEASPPSTESEPPSTEPPSTESPPSDVTSLPSSPSPASTTATSQRRLEARRVFEFWRQDTGHHRSKLDRKRLARIEARLRDGFSGDDLVAAIKHRRNDPFLMGGGPDGRVYDGVETLLRDCAQVERLRDLTTPRKPTLRGPGPVQRDHGHNPFFSLEAHS